MSIWCTYFTKSFVIQPFRKLIRFQSVFGGRQQQYGLFLQIDAMCCDSHSIQGLFKVFSAILSRGKTHFSLVMSLNRKTNISSNCSSVCIPPHHLVPMIQSLYQMLPRFPSAVPGPTSSLWGSVGDMLSWGQNQPEHLADTVALNTGSSNHVVADQLFWNITALPHLTCVLCFVVYFDGVWRCFAIWLKGSCKSVWGLGVVPYLVWFGSFCNVSFPLSPFCWLLEAAQRHGIFHGEYCVQELPVFPDHWLHWRGESPPAQRTGPLTGHCTRRSVSQKFKSK